MSVSEMSELSDANKPTNEGWRTVCARREITGAQNELIQKHKTKTGHESSRLYHIPTDSVVCCAWADRDIFFGTSQGDAERSNSETRLIILAISVGFVSRPHPLTSTSALASVVPGHYD